MAENPKVTRRKFPVYTPEPVAPPPPPSTPPPPQEMSELRKWLGMGMRGVGGLAGFTPITGAAFGGGADVLAQMIERNTFDPSEVDYRQTAAEAGVGAIGGTYAKVLMKLMGKPLAAAARGGLLGAAMPVARHGIQEGDFNPLNYPGEVALSAGISGATGGLLSKFLGGKTPTGPSYQVDTNAVPGGQVIGPGGKGVKPTKPLDPIQGTGQAITVDPPTTAFSNDLGNTPYIGQPVAPSRAAESARLNSEKLTRIEDAITDGGLQRGDPSVGESFSATTPEGSTRRLGYRFNAPEEAEEGADALGTLLRGGPDAPPPVAPADDVAGIEAQIAELQAKMDPVDVNPPSAITPEVLPPEQAEESFADIMARITEQAKTQSLDDVVAQVPEGNPGIRALTPDGMVSGPVGQDAGDAMGALQDDIPTGVPELPAGPEANPDLIQQLRNLRPAQEGLDLLGKEGRYGRLQNQFKAGTGSKEDARGAGKLLRYAAGEVGAPTGKAAAQPRPPLAPSAEAPVAPSWADDEGARWTRLTPEERSAELAGESTPSPTQMAPEAPGAAPEATSDVEPDWVRQEMAKLEAREAKTNPMEASQGLETPEEAGRVMSDIDAFLNKQNAVEPNMPDAGPASSKPRLNKRSGERGAVPIGLINSLASGTLGAGVGAAWDPLDDRTESALAGFGVGAAAPHAPSFISKLAKQAGANTNSVDKWSEKIGGMIPQLQRANYLYDPIGLSANTFAGPYGSATMGSLEKALGGDPRGLAVLKELNPLSFGKEFPNALKEAKTLPGRMERGESTAAFDSLTNPIDQYAQLPGMTMTGGDVTARNFLQRGGFSEHEARQMTMTSDPFTPGGKGISELPGFVMDMLLPFKRTPINLAEQAALRTPGLGFLMQGIGKRAGTRPADSLRQQLVQQGMGAGVLVGSEQLGENMSPEQAKLYRRYITNAAGPYSMLAGAGMAVGQGRQRGQSKLNSLRYNLMQQLPVPSLDRVDDLFTLLGKVDKGQDLSREDIPRGVFPSAIRQTQEYLEEHELKEELRRLQEPSE